MTQDDVALYRVVVNHRPLSLRSRMDQETET
jgi:hypothetical protein